MSRYRYPQPPNEDAFEDFCLALAKETWSKPYLERYGKRGERQNGIDLLDMSGQTPLFAVQCKHHDAHKALQPQELQDEVDKVLEFADPVGTYIVLTTAKKSKNAQNRVRKLNEKHRLAAVPLMVRLLTWDEMENLIDNSPTARALLGVRVEEGTVQAIKSAIAPIDSLLRRQVAEAKHGELDEAKAEEPDEEAQSRLFQQMLELPVRRGRRAARPRTQKEALWLRFQRLRQGKVGNRVDPVYQSFLDSLVKYLAGETKGLVP